MPLNEHQTQPLAGTFYFNGKAKSHRAWLVKNGDRLTIKLDAEAEVLGCRAHEVKVSEALANLPSRLVFNTGDAFECADTAAFALLFNQHRSGVANAVHKLERSTKWALLALVLMPLLAYGALTWLMPMAAVSVADAIPSALVKQLDQQVLASMDGYVFAPTKATVAQQQKLQHVWAKLPHGLGYTLLSKDGGVIGANAMALPGGSIIVTDALLALLSEDELLAVLAHEMGHVDLQHGLRNIVQSLGVTLVFSTIIGDVSLLAESALVAAPVIIQQMSYSRDMEREADEFAHRKLTQMGISPACLGSALKRLMDSHKQTGDANHAWQSYLSTHPSISERVASAQGVSCGASR